MSGLYGPGGQMLEVRDALRQKIALVNEFTRLGETLQAVLKSGDVDGLQQVLAARQRVIDAINELDRRVAPAAQNNPGKGMPGLSGDTAEGGIAGEIRQLAGEARRCLERALEMERQVKAGLEQCCQELDHNLDTLRAARRAGNMYRQRARQLGGYFVDSKK